MMQINDLQRSYKQYIKQQDLGHLQISFIQKILLSSFLITSLLLLLTSFVMKKKEPKSKILFIFPFNDKEPMGTILQELDKLEESQVIIHPNALPVLPFLFFKDFWYSLWTTPLWTFKNLDFFGALAIKLSKYYGYKRKYGISKLLLFQEYSFYSSYLTYVFESENAFLYNLMHGVPGPEASFFRFTKCFVWGEYFKSYYLKHNAEEKQFIVVGSIFHRNLSFFTKNKKNITVQYDILYALQGDSYGNRQYLGDTFSVLKKLQVKYHLKIAIKPHPIYSTNIPIPNSFDIITFSLEESIVKSKLILSHFSTIFLDAKVLHCNVMAFLAESQQELVAYLDKQEVCFLKKDLYTKLEKVLEKGILFKTSFKNIINLDINTLKVLEDEIN